jgi:hypothetical protein
VPVLDGAVGELPHAATLKMRSSAVDSLTSKFVAIIALIERSNFPLHACLIGETRVAIEQVQGWE